MLRAVGEQLGVDRVSLWDVRKGARTPSLVERWTRRDRDLPATKGRALGADDLPWLMERIQAGRGVAFRRIAELPREAHRELRWFARHGPRSCAMVPIVVGGAAEAALVAGTVRRERSWPGSSIRLLERAAVLLGIAIVRQRAHESALESEGRLGGLVEAGPCGVLLAHRSGRIELANARAGAILLSTRQELCSGRLQDVLLPSTDPPRRRGVLGAIEALLGNGEPVRMRARRGDGSTAPVDVVLREVHVPGGDLLCCGIADVSADVRARDEAARIRDEIAFRGRMALVAEMGPGIAHELNQPLTAILSNAEAAQRLLRSSRLRDALELRETMRDVVKDTRRAADILGRMREMLQHRPVDRVAVETGALLRGVAGRFRERALSHAIRLGVEIAPGLRPVVGDPVQIEQVVMNLVLNAFESLGEGTTPPRTVVLRARPTREGVSISVHDSGPGLDDEVLAHAFEPFFTTKPNGTGIGLSISRSIVEAHGGRLLARNDPGGGATFELELPSAPPLGSAGEKRRPA